MHLAIAYCSNRNLCQVLHEALGCSGDWNQCCPFRHWLCSWSNREKASCRHRTTKPWGLPMSEDQGLSLRTEAWVFMFTLNGGTAGTKGRDRREQCFRYQQQSGTKALSKGSLERLEERGERTIWVLALPGLSAEGCICHLTDPVRPVLPHERRDSERLHITHIQATTKWSFSSLYFLWKTTRTTYRGETLKTSGENKWPNQSLSPQAVSGHPTQCASCSFFFHSFPPSSFPLSLSWESSKETLFKAKVLKCIVQWGGRAVIWINCMKIFSTTRKSKTKQKELSTQSPLVILLPELYQRKPQTIAGIPKHSCLDGPVSVLAG